MTRVIRRRYAISIQLKSMSKEAIDQFLEGSHNGFKYVLVLTISSQQTLSGAWLLNERSRTLRIFAAVSITTHHVRQVERGVRRSRKMRPAAVRVGLWSPPAAPKATSRCMTWSCIRSTSDTRTYRLISVKQTRIFLIGCWLSMSPKVRSVDDSEVGAQ